MLLCCHGISLFSILSLVVTTASFRGVSAVDASVVWASGTEGAVVRTIDGGKTWSTSKVEGSLDFRGIHALNVKAAWILSSGPGDKSRIYKTEDGGEKWTLQFTNPDAQGFFDAISFFDAQRGIVLGDPVDGHFAILTTNDGGKTWTRQAGPAALPNEGAFAASNTCLIVQGKNTAWFATGGARVFRSDDGGRTWTVASTPIRHDSVSAGIFSLAFSGEKHGVAVGGDYSKPNENTANIAITSDGGRTWSAPAGTRPNGYRSAVIHIGDRWFATGPGGTDISLDNGNSWKSWDAAPYNALAAAAGTLWAVGGKGHIARMFP